jgi:hypothetical protein
MRTALSLLLLAVVVYLSACGSEESAYYDTAAESEAMAPASEAADYSVYAGNDLSEKVVTVSDEPSQGTTGAPFKQVSAADQRKIIFTANIQLVVDEFEGVTKSVSELAKKHGGFIASSNIHGSEGEPRRGDWTLRIPSQHFDTFVEGSKSLGQVRSHRQDSQEVTAEYVDLQARVRNLKAEETRLHKHLDESTRSLKDILEVEREIARVRGEIERIEGRLNVLKDLTALSTVTLSIEEIKDYVPEPTQEPGFATQVARTWGGSIDTVGGFLTKSSLFIVGFVPWLVVIVPLAFVAWMVLRRVRKHLGQPIAAATPRQTERPKTTG